MIVACPPPLYSGGARGGSWNTAVVSNRETRFTISFEGHLSAAAIQLQAELAPAVATRLGPYDFVRRIGGRHRVEGVGQLTVCGNQLLYLGTLWMRIIDRHAAGSVRSQLDGNRQIDSCGINRCRMRRLRSTTSCSRSD